MEYRLGLDTGGTFTDAVLVDVDQNVLCSGKSLTTHSDLIRGLRGAVKRVTAKDSVANISLVCLSTTLATNALVEGRGRRVGLVLIGFSESQLRRAELSKALAGDPYVILAGGHDAQGMASCALDTQSLKTFIEKINDDVDAYAVAGLFATRNPEHEKQAQAIIACETGKPVSCAHYLSMALDAPRRALTALLNARLIPMIDALLTATLRLLVEMEIEAPLMVVKGDGSLIAADVARMFPVQTILSGPAASVVGAQFLCSEPGILVSDMGGTTTDIAVIENGQPRLCEEGAVVGGWRTMVKAIDIRSYALGGDSSVVFDTTQRVFVIGPQRTVPLSSLATDYPDVVGELQAQLELPMSTTHSAQFVMAHAAKPGNLSRQQQELFSRIQERPIALQTLFKDQTLGRALLRLEQQGVVIRAGFTPTDASHVLGLCDSGNCEAAVLGAKLLARFSGANLGSTYSDETDFAHAIRQQIVQLSCMAMLDTASASCGHALSASEHELIRRSLPHQHEQGIKKNSLVSLTPKLHAPVLGLGAPVASYYPMCEQLLGTRISLPEHAEVANAIGAVVGSIRQEQLIVITPAGGEKVSVMLPGGPRVLDTLEMAVDVAIESATFLAREKATLAGGSEIAVQIKRRDNIVDKNGQSVFFESQITAIASARPTV